MEENRVKHTQGSGSGGYYFLLFSKFPELTSILLEGQRNPINTCNDKKNKGHRMTFEFYKTSLSKPSSESYHHGHLIS